MSVLDASQQALLRAAEDRRRRRAGNDETDRILQVVMLLEMQLPLGQALNLVQKKIPAPRAARLRAGMVHELLEHAPLEVGRTVYLRIVEGKVQHPGRFDLFVIQQVTDDLLQRRGLADT